MQVMQENGNYYWSLIPLGDIRENSFIVLSRHGWPVTPKNASGFDFPGCHHFVIESECKFRAYRKKKSANMLIIFNTFYSSSFVVFESCTSHRHCFNVKKKTKQKKPLNIE